MARVPVLKARRVVAGILEPAKKVPALQSRGNDPVGSSGLSSYFTSSFGFEVSFLRLFFASCIGYRVSVPLTNPPSVSRGLRSGVVPRSGAKVNRRLRRPCHCPAGRSGNRRITPHCATGIDAQRPFGGSDAFLASALYDLSLVHLGNRYLPRHVRLFKEFAAQLTPKLFQKLPV
jgi:hypothetical protein